LGEVSIEKALIEVGRHDFEPDLCFWSKDKTVGWTKSTMVFPVPDFVVEILSGSTENRDRGVKFEAYQAYGVGEYWIIDPVKEVVEQYFLDASSSVPQFMLAATLDKAEQISCRVIDGFSCPVKAIFNENQAHTALLDLLNA